MNSEIDETEICGKVTTKWWFYFLILIIFAIIIVLVVGLIYAQKQIFPDTIKLYTLPVEKEKPDTLPRRISGSYFYPKVTK